MRFRAELLRSGKSATGFQIPAEVVESLGGGRRPPVVVSVNGYSYRNTVAVMGGVYMVGVSAEHRAGAGITGGEEYDVDLELDTEPRVVTVPPDLAAALDAEPAVRRAFDALSYTGQRQHVLAVESAKTDDTRRRRIAKVQESLRGGAR